MTGSNQVPHAILRLAARQLGPAQRVTVYQEEWLPELTYILKGSEARPITRLIAGIRYALGILLSARRIARYLHRPALEQPRYATAAVPGAEKNFHSFLGRRKALIGLSALIGAPVGIWLLQPVAGAVIVTAEIASVFIVIASALFGSEILSERAFRLLRWFSNRPEPPGPRQSGPGNYHW